MSHINHEGLEPTSSKFARRHATFTLIALLSCAITHVYIPTTHNALVPFTTHSQAFVRNSK